MYCVEFTSFSLLLLNISLAQMFIKIYYHKTNTTLCVQYYKRPFIVTADVCRAGQVVMSQYGKNRLALHSHRFVAKT